MTAELHPGGPGLVDSGAHGMLLHANHFLAPNAAVGDRAHVDDPGSYGRLDDLRARLGERPPRDREAALADAVQPRRRVRRDLLPPGPGGAGDRWATLATVALDPAHGTLAVRAGGPCAAGDPWWSPDLPASTQR